MKGQLLDHQISDAEN